MLKAVLPLKFHKKTLTVCGLCLREGFYPSLGLQGVPAAEKELEVPQGATCARGPLSSQGWDQGEASGALAFGHRIEGGAPKIKISSILMQKVLGKKSMMNKGQHFKQTGSF